MIDIRGLRIGSHVRHEGKRVSVCEIQTVRPEGCPMRVLIAFNGLVCGNPSIDEVEPIPITPSLLTELGFEEKRTYGLIEVWMKDDMSFAFEGKHISFHFKHGSAMPVKYLHQVETMLAIYGVELLND